MIELVGDSLVFSFPEVHPEARLEIAFQKTLRIPDDGRDYPLPAGLGKFPVRHVDDFADRVPSEWVKRGGVMLPMWQSEAMWISFSCKRIEARYASYPFAVKIAAGKINAVNGEPWNAGLPKRKVEPPRSSWPWSSKPKPQSPQQDYVIAPSQPWLDGFCVERGVVRQFVAMRLGSGCSIEEQVTGVPDFGGLQVLVRPMSRASFEHRFPKPQGRFSRDVRGARYSGDSLSDAMGMGMGGRIRQEIAADSYDLSDWDANASSRCFVHLMDSAMWRAATGAGLPTTPITSRQYERAGIPWFSYYDESITPITGSDTLRKQKSVLQVLQQSGAEPLPSDESISPSKIIELRAGLQQNQVREAEF